MMNLFSNGTWRSMMKFFSNGTWRPRAPTIEEVPTPVGARCSACGHAIQNDDCGLSMIHMEGNGNANRSWHLDCFRKALEIEGVNA